MKKIKIILQVFIFMILCNIFIQDVEAASGKIVVSSSTNQVVVGNTFKVKITLSSSTDLGSLEYSLDYDTNMLSFVSSNLEGSTRASWFSPDPNPNKNNGNTSKTYTVTFKAKNSGTTSIGVKNYEILDENDNVISMTVNKANVKMITQKELESSYSSDNTLSKISIDGYTLTPSFNKNTTKYSLTVPNDVNSIRLSATANDTKARVSGTGNISLHEGNNQINIVVTAENGNKKTYTINVTVKELNPITVTVDGKEYTVIRKSNLLENPATYTSTTTVIKGEEVPAFTSSITNYTLVGLSDPEGNVALYIYNDNQFIKYNEYKFGGITIFTIEPNKDDLLDGLKTITINLNSEDVSAYELDGLSYPLIHGVNIETGETNWYTYDKSENTLQKYVASNTKITDDNSSKKQESMKDKDIVTVEDTKYKNLCLILGGITLILFIFLIIAAIKISKNKKAEI